MIVRHASVPTATAHRRRIECVSSRLRSDDLGVGPCARALQPRDHARDARAWHSGACVSCEVVS